MPKIMKLKIGFQYIAFFFRYLVTYDFTPCSKGVNGLR